MSLNQSFPEAFQPLAEHFEKSFGRPLEHIARAPGRVNLIGEHIDYNGGFVLPIAIQREVRLAVAARADNTMRLASMQMKGQYEGPLLDKAIEMPTWANYPLGVAREFDKLNRKPGGFDAVIDGGVPLGSGLSSSAALEVATACAIEAMQGEALDPLERALLCQRAENQFVGVNCGLMDQAASSCCRKGHALLLDCGKPEYKQTPFPEDKLAVIVAHSGVHRGLSASAYNERRGQCEQALEILNKASGAEYPHLCAMPGDVFDKYSPQLPELLQRRARHAVREMIRVESAVKMLAEEKLEQIGRILNESHYSLRDDYEVSCEELDKLTGLARSFDGVYGSRLTGAGFGGCTVTLANPQVAEDLIAFLNVHYYQPRQLEPLVFSTTPAPGAEVFSLA